MSDTEKRYIFWLSHTRAVEFPSEIVKYAVDAQKLVVITEPPFTLPLRQIVECRAVFVSRYTHYVELVVWGEQQPWKILSPVNPYFPTAISGIHRYEIHALVEVVNSLKSGAKISLDPDPYKREFRHNKRWVKAGDIYDANVSPIIYYRTRLEPGLKKIYFALGVVLVIVFVLVFIMPIVTRFLGLFY